LLKKYDINLPEIKNFENASFGNEDSTARKILQAYHPIMLTKFIPLFVEGDGNCLFQALSRGLFGNECHHVHLRLITSIEVALNQNFYDVNHKDLKKTFQDHRLVHPTYKTFLRDLASIGGCSEMFTISVVSAALGIGISSYSPPTLNKNLFEPLTKDIFGRNVRRSNFTKNHRYVEHDRNACKFTKLSSKPFCCAATKIKLNLTKIFLVIIYQKTELSRLLQSKMKMPSGKALTN